MRSEPRRDAARNRRVLIDAARDVLSADGPDAPLERVARAAGVSRTTLHRHFPTRDELALAVVGDNVNRIEDRARALDGDPAGLVTLFDFVVDLQLDGPALVRHMSRTDFRGFTELAGRTAAAFELLLPRAQQDGVLHPGVTVRHLMIAMPMVGAAALEDRHAGRPAGAGAAREILHRGLFTGS